MLIERYGSAHYWARKAVKELADTYPKRAVKGEMLDHARLKVSIDDAFLSLTPDEPALVKAVAKVGEPDVIDDAVPGVVNVNP